MEEKKSLPGRTGRGKRERAVVAVKDNKVKLENRRYPYLVDSGYFVDVFRNISFSCILPCLTSFPSLYYLFLFFFSPCKSPIETTQPQTSGDWQWSHARGGLE